MKSPFGDAGDAQFMVKNPLEDTDPASLRRRLASRSEFSDLSRLSDAQVRAQVAALSSTGRLPAARERVPQNARPTVQSTPEEKAAAVVTPVVKQPSLRILSLDDHFAPRAERITINYRVDEVSAKKVILQVSSDHYPNNPIYEKELTGAEKSNGVHSLQWDGKTTCSAGPLKDLYLNPLYAPYKVTLKADGLQDKAEFKVFYHSVTLAPGSYTADGKAPAEKDHLKWVQYRLNELGYFAGPIDGVKNDQTKRALKRYSYAAAGLTESDDENNKKLIELLKKGYGKRTIIEGAALPPPGKSVKSYIDYDYFYETFAEFLDDAGHVNKQKAKLDRFEFPVEATVYLVSKYDVDGSSRGVFVPEATGAVEVEWRVRDPLEDTSLLPVSTPDIPTRCKPYIDAALVQTGQNAGQPNDAKDNCPTGASGVRGTNKDYFADGTKLPPFQTALAGDQVFTKVYGDVTKNPNKSGKAGVLFRGSYHAGDNYALQAKVALRNAPDATQLAQLHEALFKKKFDEQVIVDTGTITLWRRLHVAATVYWPQPPLGGIRWNEVVDQYRPAHCEMDVSGKTFSIKQLFTTKKDQDNYLKIFHKHFPAYKKSDLKFNPNGVSPVKLRSQGKKETPANYRAYIDTKAKEVSDKLDFLMDMAELVQAKVKSTEGAGNVAMQVHWVPPTPVCDLNPVSGEINLTTARPYSPAITCIGLRRGVAVLDNTMIPTEQDGFLYAHEMGHCRYLSHHETSLGAGSDNPTHHDQNDFNCTMCYPEGIASRPNLTWQRGNATEPRFCGKCLLKLRGWDIVNGGLPAQS